MKNRFTRTTVLPLALLIYLAVLAWMARGRFYSGDYLYYFGVIGGSLIIILLLYLVLRKRDRLRREREEEQYGTYDEETSTRNLNPAASNFSEAHLAALAVTLHRHQNIT